MDEPNNRVKMHILIMIRCRRVRKRRESTCMREPFLSQQEVFDVAVQQLTAEKHFGAICSPIAFHGNSWKYSFNPVMIHFGDCIDNLFKTVISEELCSILKLLKVTVIVILGFMGR